MLPDVVMAVMPTAREDAAALRTRVEDRWVWVGRFPFPRFVPVCPQRCDSPLQLSRVGFGMQPRSPRPYRADVMLKCCLCSCVVQFGIPITPERYCRATEGGGPIYGYREILEELERAHEA